MDGISGSDSKVVLGQKMGLTEDEEKLRGLESVSRLEAQAGSRANKTAQKDIALDLNANVEPTHRDEQKPRGFNVDLNAKDISSSINHDPFYPYKNYENLKLRDDSDCASSVGPLEEKDPMRVWKKMKQNNYLSTSYAPAPVVKPRGRKSKIEAMKKKKIELAKKEQVDRFARIAAPSGLLNGLNPGIINHVRNSKQVHSIIEAVVKSAKTENQQSGSKQMNQGKSGTKEDDDLLERWQMSGYPLPSKSIFLNFNLSRGDGESCGAPSQNNPENEDVLALKLSSSTTTASANNCSEESANVSGVTSLSVKAANTASQWLELLNQDIKGRLAALRRSKKRVRAVIHTELPLLMSREFTSNQETDMNMEKDSIDCHPDKATADAHFVRWSTLFGEMDKTLCEEEEILESWLKQVKEMQLNCEWGLSKHNGHHTLRQIENDFRLGEADDSDRDLAVSAAAASIYSTCKFSSSTENLPCP